MCNALDLVGFDGEFQENLFICLAAILHLGNIEFYEDSNDYSHILDPRAGPVQRTAVRARLDGMSGRCFMSFAAGVAVY